MQIAKLAGIPVRIHMSFWVLGLAFIIMEWQQNGLEQMLMTLIMFVALFTSVMIHEFGHALAARHFGIHTDSITLYPFGGIARMRDLSHRPKKEMIVALSGPLVNIAISVLCGTLWWYFGTTSLAIIALINLAMALFNLVPAYPMDGGRVLRSVLSLWLGYSKATKISVAVGRWCAYGFLIGSFPAESWSLAFVGAFLLFSHHIERHQQQRALQT